MSNSAPVDGQHHSLVVGQTGFKFERSRRRFAGRDDDRRAVFADGELEFAVAKIAHIANGDAALGNDDAIRGFGFHLAGEPGAPPLDLLGLKELARERRLFHGAFVGSFCISKYFAAIRAPMALAEAAL